MKNSLYGFIKRAVSYVDKQTVFLSLGILLTVSYYLDPLSRTDIFEWDRTFSTAVISGISINNRIGNFYLLFLVYLPAAFLVLLISLSYLFKYRDKYKEIFSKYCVLTVVTAIISLISRYSVATNPLIKTVIVFWFLLVIVAIIDRKCTLEFQDIVLCFLSFICIVLLASMLLSIQSYNIILILASAIVLFGTFFLIKVSFLKDYILLLKNFLYLMMWMPALMRLELEIIYILTGKGHEIQSYFSIIAISSLAFVLLFFVIAFFTSRLKRNVTEIGYIGFILSIGMLAFFSYNYQYTWSYGSYADIYEIANGTVAADTVRFGKLPIIDYFSAHALDDVLTRIIYCLINGDVKGVLVDPYRGMANTLALIIVYSITKKLFDKHSAVLYVVLFPGLITSIKWTSVCCLSFAALVYICKERNIKRYILFWISLLFSAFFVYDEGISIGIACILAFLLFSFINKRWKDMLKFLCCGMGIGICALFVFLGLCFAKGIPAVSRIREWLSVSLESSSSWATADFGDSTSFAFFISYFLVPVTAVLLLVFVVVKYIKHRSHEVIVHLTVAFSITEILYITRTIVYHNLAVCSGWTGVLLNFIHWTVSLYVLLLFTEKEKTYNIRLLGWQVSMMAVILIEGTAVTTNWPTVNSSVLYRAISSSESWELSNSVTENIGKERVVFDNVSANLVKQYKDVFDTLLTDNQTFLDFANVTSIYFLTDRKRPCYVSQTPSLLTDLYSQDCFFEQIEEYDCPLAIVGTTEGFYLSRMAGVPHNIRYYRIAEYIYNNYRPLVGFSEVAIWCKIDNYERYKKILEDANFSERGYRILDYGYDFTTELLDEKGEIL